MNKYVKLIVAITAIVGYVLILRCVAPSREPYFFLGIALIGCMAWLYGIASGLLTALLLVPATSYIYSQFGVSTSYMAFAGSPAYIAVEVLAAVVPGVLNNRIGRLTKRESMLAGANEKLQKALSQVQEIGGIHSLCTVCKSILDDDGSWTKVDIYLKEKTKAEFSHGMCPDCAKEYGITPKPEPEGVTTGNPVSSPE
ncbi:MAG: hypothetical protein DRP64_10490 [Verrucomicrobia bacterium]|nr:MAG: hypothetical protein DRP64_10490 [Verrucomicrobiota bacterium]